MMVNILWERYSVKEEFYIWGNYTLKRKRVGNAYIYEVWQGYDIKFTTPSNSEFLLKIHKDYKNTD